MVDLLFASVCPGFHIILLIFLEWRCFISLSQSSLNLFVQYHIVGCADLSFPRMLNLCIVLSGIVSHFSMSYIIWLLVAPSGPVRLRFKPLMGIVLQWTFFKVLSCTRATVCSSSTYLCSRAYWPNLWWQVVKACFAELFILV